MGTWRGLRCICLDQLPPSSIHLGDADHLTVPCSCDRPNSGQLTMAQLLDIAELLVASWALAGKGNGISTSHRILDRALKEAIWHDSCPKWVRDSLHFSDSRIGLQCIELPSLLDWSQRAQLTSAPNPSQQSVQVQISPSAAQHLLRQLEVPVEDAKSWGKNIHALVEQACYSKNANFAAIEES